MQYDFGKMNLQRKVRVIEKMLDEKFPPEMYNYEYMWEQSRATVDHIPQRPRPSNVYLHMPLNEVLTKCDIVNFMRAASDMRVNAIFMVWPRILIPLADKLEKNEDHLTLMKCELQIKNSAFLAFAKDGVKSKASDTIPALTPDLNGQYTTEEMDEIHTYAKYMADNYLAMVPRTLEIYGLTEFERMMVEFWRYTTYDMYTGKD